MIYKLRSYGGADSLVISQLQDFLINFQKPNDSWLMRAGVTPLLTNARALDLLGVKFDFTPTGAIIMRPNALARLSALTNFMVIPNKHTQLRLLNKNNFDLTKTLILSKKPQWIHSTKMTKRFSSINFISTRSDEINCSSKF